jgi:hypothetical protein
MLCPFSEAIPVSAFWKGAVAKVLVEEYLAKGVITWRIKGIGLREA